MSGRKMVAAVVCALIENEKCRRVAVRVAFGVNGEGAYMSVDKATAVETLGCEAGNLAVICNKGDTWDSGEYVLYIG